MQQLNLPGITSAARFERMLQKRFERSIELVGYIRDEDEVAPVFGFDAHRSHGVMQYVAWWLDGDTDNNLHI